MNRRNLCTLVVLLLACPVFADDGPRTGYFRMHTTPLEFVDDRALTSKN